MDNLDIERHDNEAASLSLVALHYFIDVLLVAKIKMQ